MSDLREVNEGDKLVASGDNKAYEVVSIEDGNASLKQIDLPEVVKPEPEETIVPVEAILESDSWLPYDEASAPEDESAEEKPEQPEDKDNEEW